jgi:hypothetical protein
MQLALAGVTVSACAALIGAASKPAYHHVRHMLAYDRTLRACRNSRNRESF